MTKIFIFSGKAHEEKSLIITWKKKKKSLVPHILDYLEKIVEK